MRSVAPTQGRSCRSALTLIELMVVVTIALITTAIAVPIARKAIHASKVRQSCAQLKQIHMAMTLYRTDHGGDGKYGVPYWDMGLPQGLGSLIGKYGLSKEVLIPPGIGHLSFGPRYYVPYVHINPGEQQRWETYSGIAEERSVLSYDISLDDTGSPRLSDKSTHFYIGMYMDGLAQPVRQVGFHGDLAFWLRARGLTRGDKL